MATATQIITSDFNARSTALEVASAVSLQGKNAVITGGASGLGLETSRALVSAGAQVTLAVRNLKQGNSAAVALKAEFPAAHIQVAKLDLSDLATVRQFAADWNASGQPLSILINNAAIMACPLTRTAQGAATSVWAATAPALKGHGGLYLEDCRQGLPAEPTNRVSGYSPHIADPALAQRLWAVSEQLLAAA